MRAAAVVAICALGLSGCIFSSSEPEPTERVRLSFAPFTPGPTMTPSPAATVSPTPEIPRRTLGPQAAPTTSTPAPTAVDCPVGEVRASITEVVASQREPDEWDVRVAGQVRNDTEAMVRNVEVRIVIHVPNNDEERGSAEVTGPLAPGTSLSFSEVVDVEADDEPEEEHVRVSVRDWSWGNADQDEICARGASG